MSARARAAAVPLLAGLVAAAAAFAIVLVATRDAAPPASTTTAPAAAAPAAAGGGHGRAVFTAMGCGSCHRLAAAGSQGQIGPPLDQALANHTRASLRAKIVDPGSSVMPSDFGRRMSARDLDALVDFLLAGRRDAPR